MQSVWLILSWLIGLATGSSLLMSFLLLAPHVMFTPFPSVNSSSNCFLPSAPSWPGPKQISQSQSVTDSG